MPLGRERDTDIIPAVKERRVYESIADLVGSTPLVRLNRCVRHLECEVWAKIEFLNPMGSVKDRIARHMISRALERGELRAGDMVIENSSGNTAMGLAMMSVLEDLDCRMVVRKQTSKEKLDCLRAMGVDLVLVDGCLPPEDPNSYNQAARRLAAETEGAFFPDQHNNRENSQAHYETTGPEIWEQMEGRIDCLVAGIGTGGTICGSARFLKEQDPNVRVVAVDPIGSVFHHHFHTGQLQRPGRYLLEGLGDEELIECPDWDLIDDVLQIEDGQAFRAARRLAKTDAILAGGSSGAALWGVEQMASKLPSRARIVTVFPDSGTRYLSTIFNDEWMREQGFLEESPQDP